ncbi:MAG: tol-pal system-associated acyl-CoA thioesterase [Kistimonas sp.]|nr:tol-pal system-associated acyl-CoA thioesterase [Kistimonas sp.]
MPFCTMASSSRFPGKKVVSTPVFMWSTRVYYEDTDAGGVVYYANYLRFMERARTEYLRSMGFYPGALMEEGIMLVVRRADVAYRSPARLDDLVEVSVGLSRLGQAGLDVEQTVYREGEPLCKAAVALACVRVSSMRPAALPADLRQSLVNQQQAVRAGATGREERV